MTWGTYEDLKVGAVNRGFTEMIGSTLVACLVEEYNQTSLAWITKESKCFMWSTEADCCSNTWFADVNGIDLPAEVTNVELIPMPLTPQDERGRQDEDRFYGIKVHTDRGLIDIVFRNSSNGYYSGDASCALADFPEAGFKEITGDWRA